MVTPRQGSPDHGQTPGCSSTSAHCSVLIKQIRFEHRLRPSHGAPRWDLQTASGNPDVTLEKLPGWGGECVPDARHPGQVLLFLTDVALEKPASIVT